MQELPVAIDEGPQESGPDQPEGKPGQRISAERLLWRQLVAVGAFQSQLPGLHGQGLASFEPAPVEIQPDSEEQIDLEDVPVPPGERGVGAERSEECQPGEENHAEQQQPFVQHGCEPAGQTGWLVRACRGHRRLTWLRQEGWVGRTMPWAEGFWR